MDIDIDDNGNKKEQDHFVDLDRLPGKWYKKDSLSHEQFTRLLLLIDRGIAHSLEASNGLLARYFCAAKMIMVDHYGPKYMMQTQGHDIWKKYRPFIPNEWIYGDGNVHIPMPISLNILNLPVYTY